MAIDHNSSVPISSSAAQTGKMICLDRKRTVFPARPSQQQHIKLSPLDLQMLFVHYIQKGLLYETPVHDFSSAVDLLAKSLSQLLPNFYPLAGRLTTSPSDGELYIDCNDSGADFIEASADHLSVADVTSPEVTLAVEELLALDGAVNLDGHRLPLLVVQVTKLRNGIFVGCTVSHAVADGTSFWHFFTAWAELCKGDGKISVASVHDRCLISPQATVRLNLDPEGEIPRFCPPPLRVKMFNFSEETVKALKERANRGSHVPISSFQALCGHLWQAITRARGLGPDDPTTFRLFVNCRSRVVPPLPSCYFGNAIQNIFVRVCAGELAGKGVSFPAGLLHGIIEGHRDGVIREAIDRWEKAPAVSGRDKLEKNVVVMGSSPRFRMYENDFGWGEPVAVRSGSANHYDGKVSAYPGKKGGNSVELEICLLPRFMEALEIDQNFLCSVCS